MYTWIHTDTHILGTHKHIHTGAVSRTEPMKGDSSCSASRTPTTLSKGIFCLFNWYVASYIYMCVCMCVCICICICVGIQMYREENLLLCLANCHYSLVRKRCLLFLGALCIYTYAYLRIYVYIYIYIYINLHCIYIYICIYTYKYIVS